MLWSNELSALLLSQMALATAMDLGFNAVEVYLRFDYHKDQADYCFKFGNHKTLRNASRPPSGNWALSYSEEVPCTRTEKLVVVPEKFFEQRPLDLGDYITQSLLELA